MRVSHLFGGMATKVKSIHRNYIALCCLKSTFSRILRMSLVEKKISFVSFKHAMTYLLCRVSFGYHSI